MDAEFLSTPRHAVAVIGGACAGAEAAEILAKAGILTVVLDQNARPFGKIDGSINNMTIGMIETSTAV